MPSIKFTNTEGYEAPAEVDRIPDACPRCFRSIQPILCNKPFESPQNELRIMFKCPSSECQRPFFAFYRFQYGTGVHFNLEDLEPTEMASYTWDDSIMALSPRFVTIFNQASNCQRLRLDEVAGPAYRKALEVLVKDFSKADYLARIADATTDDATKQEARLHVDAIDTLQLKPCIDQYIDDSQIHATAERAAWLGNDQVHYIQKWPEHDLKSLKGLIDLVVYFIQAQHRYQTMMTDMPTGR